MEYKFDPAAKVKQGDLSESTLGTKKPMETKNIKAAETQDGNFDYHEPKKFKSQIDANFDKLADEKDY